MGPKGKKVRRTLETKGGTRYRGLFEYQTPIPRDWDDHEVPSMAEKLKRSRDADLSRAREYAGAVLRKAGLPDTLRQVQKHPDGSWSELPEAFRKNFWKAVEDMPDGESIKLTNVATLVYAQEPAPAWPDGWENWTAEELEAYIESLPPPVDVPAATNGRELTPEWLACKVLELADILEADRASGDVMRVEVSAARLSEALNALLITEHYELAAIIGWKQRKDGSDHGKCGGRPIKATPEVVADLRRQADALRRLDSTLSKSALATAKRIKDRHGLAVETIRRLIKRPSATPKG